VTAGVVVLAGGEASRLPGKLALDAGGTPLVVRIFRAVAPGRETVVSCAATFAPEIDALLTAPLVVDRWKRRGPLAGLLSALPHLRARYVAAIAGDAPFVGSALLDSLEQAWRDGDEAVVPQHASGRIEPLSALYDRIAFLREGFAVHANGDGSVAGVVRRLRARMLFVGDPAALRSINTPADYAAARDAFAAPAASDPQ
jgi:molybdopterin-guanine dinucleotide biosynthesis protein A